MARPFLKPKAEREAIVRSVLELAAKGASYTSAAMRLGIAPHSFYNWAKGLGIPIPFRSNYTPYCHLNNTDRRALATRFVQLCRTGHSINKASKLVGVGRGALLAWAARYGLKFEPYSPGAKGYSTSEKHGRVSAVIRLMEDGAMFVEACGVVKSQPALIHKWATQKQRAWIDQFIRDTRCAKKVREEQAYLVAQADELSELFGSSEPLGWEAD